MHKSMSSSIIRTAFPNYYQRTKENLRFMHENTIEGTSELPKRSFVNMNSTHSNSFNYVLPDPEEYDLTKNLSKRRNHSSLSLQPKKNRLKNSFQPDEFTPKKLLNLKPHPKAHLVKQNFIKLKGYNEYSRFSPNKSFHRKQEDTKKFRKYLLHNILQPNYKRDFERVENREATKLIEKKYQFLPETKPIVSSFQNNSSFNQSGSVFKMRGQNQRNYPRFEPKIETVNDPLKNRIYKQRIISPFKSGQLFLMLKIYLF